MRGLLVISLSLFCLAGVNAQEIYWTKFEHLDDSLRKARKPLMIFIETDWCKYCQMQKRTTFADSDIVDAINSGFYALRLDAEHQSDIVFLNRTYSYSPLGDGVGFHTLAEQLSGSETVYPSTVFFNASLVPQGVLNGYVDAASMLAALNAIRPTE